MLRNNTSVHYYNYVVIYFVCYVVMKYYYVVYKYTLLYYRRLGLNFIFRNREKTPSIGHGDARAESLRLIGPERVWCFFSHEKLRTFILQLRSFAFDKGKLDKW
jgi:hypothetical protein